MVNPDFDQFMKAQKGHKSLYPGNGEKGVNPDPKANQRGNSNRNVGATGRNVE
ncbi:hypothetical protein [Aquibacillus kalidii]|uniref:hypothetical protein n=1 Tax=Aquibacillus kalidii TaxID=2762597 RepID=UPI001645FB64|nr:hypothetical protein [Aquibacillus kalidii]